MVETSKIVRKFRGRKLEVSLELGQIGRLKHKFRGRK